ncbi:MAG: HPr family phosphocarrier protein [Firmicutes bacterium]|nr:HPr family phosphocarrier protein [Bacillota bacterium]MCL1953292.1 HPr family phosphocarrier protein [Bacillota bacterium]
MKSIKIKLDKLENIHTFVKIVEKFPFDIDLKSGRYVIDAKSLLGVCSLDTSQEIIMEIHSEQYDKLLQELNDYIIK